MKRSVQFYVFRGLSTVEQSLLPNVYFTVMVASCQVAFLIVILCVSQCCDACFSSSRRNKDIAHRNYPDSPIERHVATSLGDEYQTCFNGLSAVVLYKNGLRWKYRAWGMPVAQEFNEAAHATSRLNSLKVEHEPVNIEIVGQRNGKRKLFYKHTSNKIHQYLFWLEQLNYLTEQCLDNTSIAFNTHTIFLIATASAQIIIILPLLKCYLR